MQEHRCGGVRRRSSHLGVPSKGGNGEAVRGPVASDRHHVVTIMMRPEGDNIHRCRVCARERHGQPQMSLVRMCAEPGGKNSHLSVPPEGGSWKPAAHLPMSSLIGGTPSNVHRLGAARTLVSNQGRQLEARCALFECQLSGWHTQLCAPGEVKKLGNAHALTVTYMITAESAESDALLAVVF